MQLRIDLESGGEKVHSFKKKKKNFIWGMCVSLREHYCQADHTDHSLPDSWSGESSRIALYRVSGFMRQMSPRVLFKGHQRLSQRELIQGMSVERHWQKKKSWGIST